jgi:hypothetical protein
VAFGRKEKVGTKQKQGSSQMTWVYPFQYDNIENHVLMQHPEKSIEYQNERKHGDMVCAMMSATSFLPRLSQQHQDTGFDHLNSQVKQGHSLS